jgi:ribosomal-protein-alanine N-acetyltransferase
MMKSKVRDQSKEASDSGNTFSSNLREIRPEDINNLVSLDRECFPSGEVFSIEEFYLYLYYYKSESLILSEGGEVNGFVIFSETGPAVWELVTLNVKPRIQGQGFGGKLLYTGIKSVKKHYPKEINLHVRTDNEKAISLYRKFGFVVVNSIRNYYNDKDGYLMRKEFSYD